MTSRHDPVLSEASPAELAEAFISAMGWNNGEWLIELRTQDGVIRKYEAKASSGRQSLLERRSGERPEAA